MKLKFDDIIIRLISIMFICLGFIAFADGDLKSGIFALIIGVVAIMIDTAEETKRTVKRD